MLDQGDTRIGYQESVPLKIAMRSAPGGDARHRHPAACSLSRSEARPQKRRLQSPAPESRKRGIAHEEGLLSTHGDGGAGGRLPIHRRQVGACAGSGCVGERQEETDPSGVGALGESRGHHFGPAREHAQTPGDRLRDRPILGRQPCPGLHEQAVLLRCESLEATSGGVQRQKWDHGGAV